MKNFKIISGLFTIILLLVIGGLVTSKFLSKNDAWVCDNGEWMKKGNPGVPIPETICEKEAVKNDDQDEAKDSFETIDISNTKNDFTLKLPNFWQDNYEEKIVEDDGIRRFVFNYKSEESIKPLLFILNIFPGEKNVYTIENQPNNKIIAQSENFYYTLSSALDIPFMPDEPDYEKYLEMIDSIDTIAENSIFGGNHSTRTEEIIENNHEVKWNLNVSYPIIISELDTTNLEAIIKNRVNEIISNYKNNLSEWDSTGGPEEAYSSLWLNYRLMAIADDIIVLEFYGLEYYRGAAHPNGSSFSINYDLKNNKEINLGDLFKVSEEIYLEKLSELIKAKLEAEFLEKGFETDVLMFNEGIKPLAFNFKNFNLLNDRIIFNFDPNQIGPHALGGFKVEISRDELKEILR